jgi:hypothetical protein
MTSPVRQSRRFGIIGSVVGLLALLSSALTQLLPERLLSEPVGQVTEGGGQNAYHLIFRTKRLEIRSREASEPRASGYTSNQVLATAAVSLGLLAIALAVFAVIWREQKLLAGIAAALGVAAIAVQVFWIMFGLVLLIVIVNGLLS